MRKRSFIFLITTCLSYAYLSGGDPLWLNIFQSYKHKALGEAEFVLQSKSTSAQAHGLTTINHV